MDAAEEALRHGKADTAQMKAEYDRRRQFLMTAMDKIGFQYTKPMGAFYLWVKIPDSFDGDSMAYAEHLAEKAKVQRPSPSFPCATLESHMRLQWKNLSGRLMDWPKFLQKMVHSTTSDAELPAVKLGMSAA